MSSLAQRIEALLADKVATADDDSLLHSMLRNALRADAAALGGPRPSQAPDDVAFRRVEVLLAAWEEMHREARARDELVECLSEGMDEVANLLAAHRGELCSNCGESIQTHTLEYEFGFVCPTDAAARTDGERFTYTRPSSP